MKQKTHEQWLVTVKQRWNDNWFNAIRWYPGNTMAKRYAKSEEEAKAVLDYAYKLWNGKKSYDKDGKRYETSEIGTSGLGMSVEHTRDTDHDMEIVAHRIEKRIVTNWETVEEK